MYEVKYSIILPLYGKRWSQFFFGLKSYAEQTLPKNEFELIVVDQGSDIDPNVFTGYGLNIKYIKVDLEKVGYKDCRNPAYAQNVGIQHSKGEYLIFTSPEVVLQHNGLEMISIGMNPKMFMYCACKESVSNIFNNDPTKLFTKEYLLSLPQIRWLCHPIERKEDLAYFYGVVHNKVVRDIQGLDEDYMVAVGYEDNDFGCRLNKVLKQNFTTFILTLHIDHDRKYQVDYTSWVYKGRDIWNKKKPHYNNDIKSLVANKDRVWGDPKGITLLKDYYNAQ